MTNLSIKGQERPQSTPKLKGGSKEYKPKKRNSNNEKEGKMSFVYRGRRYYRTYAEALRSRRKGDRIYYDADVGAYYIIRPQSSSWW